MKTPKRGDQVMVSPHLSGPAAGRSGCASGMRRDGHSEILDRHPDLPGAQLLGWFESEDLLPLVTGGPPRRQLEPVPPEFHLRLAEVALQQAAVRWQAGKLRLMAEAVATVSAHVLAAAVSAGAPLAVVEDSFERIGRRLMGDDEEVNAGGEDPHSDR